MADGQVIIDDNGGTDDAWNVAASDTIKIRKEHPLGASVPMDELKGGSPHKISARKIIAVKVTESGNTQPANPLKSIEISGTGAAKMVTLAVADAAGGDIFVTPSESLVGNSQIYETNWPGCIKKITVDGNLFYTRQGVTPIHVIVEYDR